MKTLRMLLFFSVITLFHSCGDKPLEDQGILNLSGLQQVCPIDAEKLAQILDEDISKEISCLEDNLNHFVNFVKRDDPNFVHIEELKKFVLQFFAPDVAERTNKLLKFVYMLNQVLLKDSNTNLSVKNIPHLFELFRVVNVHGRIIKASLSSFSDNRAMYWSSRDSVATAINNAAEAVLRVILVYPSVGRELNIVSFLDELKNILELDDEQIDIPLIKSYLFVKRLILGGDKEVVTDIQLEAMLFNLSDLTTFGLDVFHVEHKFFNTEGAKNLFYLNLIKEAQTFFYPFEKNEFIFEYDDLANVLENVFDNDWDLSKVQKSVGNLKERLIGGHRDNYSFSDIKILIGWAQEAYEMLYFNDITFEHFKETMESTKVIETIRRPALAEYGIFTKNRAKELWNQFELITLHYRYFHDEEGYLHYYREFKRFKSGFNLTATIRFFLTKLVHEYGIIPEGERRKHIGKEQLSLIMSEVEDAAKEIGLWPKDIDRFVSEAIDGSDIFQYQGDGNGYSNVEELTEYVSAIMSSTKLSDNIYNNLLKYCSPTGDDEESFELSCYREYFWHIFFNELGSQKYFSKLYQYIQSVGMEEAQQYLLNIEKYAREIPSDSVPLTQTDLKRILIALSNVESIYILYDYNNDGWLDRRELDIAYFRFETTIVKVGELEPETYKYGHSIFLYLIKKQKIPSKIQMAIFHFITSKKNIKGTRFNIAAILAFFIK